MAAGAWLAGRKTVVMCQNSGLGNAVNPLTSLSFPFRIPTLLVVTWRGSARHRGRAAARADGARSPASLLDTMRIPHRPFPARPTTSSRSSRWPRPRWTRSDLPFALVMAKDTVRDDGLDEKPARPADRPARGATSGSTGPAPPARRCWSASSASCLPAAAVVATTTGKCGRELFTLADRPQHLYQVGSMGCASAMGLGVALHTPRPVVVLDGDGAALMKLGNLATIGSRAPANLVHVVLDNGAHDSTGGQATVSPNVDFAAVALACGYASGASADSLAGFERALVGDPRGAGAAPDPRADRPGLPRQAGPPDHQASGGRPPLPAFPRRSLTDPLSGGFPAGPPFPAARSGPWEERPRSRRRAGQADAAPLEPARPARRERHAEGGGDALGGLGQEAAAAPPRSPGTPPPARTAPCRVGGPHPGALAAWSRASVHGRASSTWRLARTTRANTASSAGPRIDMALPSARLDLRSRRRSAIARSPESTGRATARDTPARYRWSSPDHAADEVPEIVGQLGDVHTREGRPR